ncbi:MAG: hypothetical protein MUC41_12200 [Syntrophobacteraceae bacterium]|nr:hypothetical protein [Syntrophobacteraceae bacterium]
MKMRMCGGFFALQKWLVIYNAMVDPRPLSEIAVHTGLAEGTVRRIIAEYNSTGPGFLEEGRKARVNVGKVREQGKRASL